MVAFGCDTLAKLCGEWAEVLRPRTMVDRPTWCEANLKLPEETSAGDTRFNLDTHPWVRGMLAVADNPITRTITVVGGTQIGKTTFEQGLLASQAELAPAPMMFAGPDRDFMREWRDKTYRLLEESPPFKAIIPPQRLRNDRWIDFGRAVAYLAWSGNPQRLSGKACKVVCCTEVDRWKHSPKEGPTAKIVRERVKAFARFLLVFEGAPIGESRILWPLYEASDRRKFLVPCPHCGHHQELRFFLHKDGDFAGCGGLVGMTDAKGAMLPTNELLASTHYLCEQGCKIRNDEKWEMIPRGVWCPDGQKVNKRGQLEGKPKRSARDVGFQISSLYSLVRSWGEVALEYSKARDDSGSLMVWWNDWLGLPFSVQSKLPKWNVLGKRLEGYHPRGVVPQPALFLTAGVDVQLEQIYWVVRAWGEGCDSWLIDHGTLLQRVGKDGAPIAGTDFEQLDAVVYQMVWKTVATNPLGRESMGVRLMCIDTNYRSHEVHAWARQKGARVRCIAGRAGMVDLWQLTAVSKSARDGKPYPGGLNLWLLNSAHFKDDIQARWSADQEKMGRWLLYQKPLKTGETYLRQLVNETPIFKRDKSGNKQRLWKVIDEKTGVDYWDGEVYARAAAEMVVGEDWHNLVERTSQEQQQRRPRMVQEYDDDRPR